MHLVGFITRIYHDVRSPERQMKKINDMIVLVMSLSRAIIVFAMRPENTVFYEIVT